MIGARRPEKGAATKGGSVPWAARSSGENHDWARELRDRLVRVSGATSQDLGLGRIFGEVLVYLYLHEEECSLDQIESDLSLSKAAVSIAARQLETLGLIRRVRRNGDRRRYYRTADTLGSALQGSVLTLLRRKLDTVDIELDRAQKQIAGARAARDPDVEFLHSRIGRAHSIIRRITGLMENPIARLLIKLQ